MSRPDALHVARDDAELATAIDTPGIDAIAVAAGDLHRTIGARPIAERTELQQLPIDVLRVRLDGGTERTAVAHLTATRPNRAGGWLRGEVLIVMNAEFLGELDLAPRGHPNDGRAESLLLDAGTPLRQRLAIRRRARTGTHLPHPAVTSRSIRSATWEFQRPMVVRLDHTVVGTATTVEVDVDADAHRLLA